MCTLGEMKLMKREREESFLLPMYYLRFGLQVLRVYLGSQFYHPNINYITQKLYILKVGTPKFMLVYFL